MLERVYKTLQSVCTRQ